MTTSPEEVLVDELVDTGRSSWPEAFAVAAGTCGSVAVFAATWLGSSTRLVPEPWISRPWLVAARDSFGVLVDNPLWTMMSVTLMFGSWVFLAGRQVPTWVRRVCALAWTLPLMWALPWGSGDMYNYAEQGWAFAHGYHPSIVEAGSSPSPYADWVGGWKGSTVAYPVGALVLSSLSTSLGSSSQFDVLQAQRLWPLLALAGLWWAVGVLADQLEIDRDLARWLGLMNPIVLLHGIAGGHHDLAAICLVTMGLAAWYRASNRPMWARCIATGVLVVAGGLVKPTMLLAVVILPLMGPGRMGWFQRLAMAAAVASGAIGLTIAISGALPGGWAWLSATGTPGQASRTMLRDLEWTAMHDPLLVAAANPVVEWFLANVESLAIVMPLVAAAILLVRPPAGGAVATLARIWTAILVFGPAGFPWYALGFVPLIGLVTRTERTLFALMAVLAAWTLAPVGPMTPHSVTAFLLYWLPIVVTAVLAGLWACQDADA